tara:strand:+ start:684 stop:932 length:249 start_codon:yes stop_codon:yes gene_type:complete
MNQKNKKQIPLSSLKKGTTASIVELKDDLKYKARFTEMGIIPGEKISLIQRYSKKGPLCVKIMESFVMIRKKNADNILVSEI